MLRLLAQRSSGPSASGLGPLPDPQAALFDEAMAEARRHPPPPAPPPPIVPGDAAQQFDVVHLSGTALWERADVQQQMARIAADTEAREAATRPGGKVVHTKIDLMNYWELRFAASVEYILGKRASRKDPDQRGQTVSVREQLRKQLARDEAKLMQSLPGEALLAQVETLRASYRQKWATEVDRAVDGFVQLAENEALLITRRNAPKVAAVFGLPLGLEKEREASEAPDQIAPGSRAVADSVVTFMAAVQAESKTKAKADNYRDHEKSNPSFDPTSIGKYSFDVDLPFDRDPATGFYDRARTIEFFKAVERAATTTKIEWVAFYNDAGVVIAVNDFIGKGRVAFSGGGGGGSFHHGPAPYLLHVHFNIMPTGLAAKFLVGTTLAKATKAIEAFWQRIDARF